MCLFDRPIKMTKRPRQKCAAAPCNRIMWPESEVNMKQPQLLAALVAIGLLPICILPCSAQNNKNTQAADSVPTGSLQRIDGDWPARTVIGTSVFNEHGQRVATIRDLLITDDGRVDRAVLVIRGRSRLVAITFNQLQFVPSQRFDVPVMAVRGRMSRMVSAAHADRRPYGVMLPGATPASLSEMESVHLTP